MLLLDRQTGATVHSRGEADRPGAPAGRVQLRLRADGQLVDLPPGKTTIGSSPRCNVRIEQPGVQPLHCLIVEGPEGLRIRSWVANTTLNGVPFEESALRVGDCLSLGSVEVDVIDPRAGLTQAAAVEAPVAESKDAEQIREGRERARAHSRQLLKSLRSERASHQELHRQVAKLQESHLDAITEQNEMSSKLESCLAELTVARRQLAESETIEAARRDLANQNEQLGFEIGELSAQINELTNARAETAKQRKHLADDLAALGEQQHQLIDTNARLQRDLGQLSTEKAATDEQNQQLSERNSQLQSELGQVADEKNSISEQHRQLAEAHIQLQSEVGQLASEKAAADDQCRQLTDSKFHLQNEFDQLTDEKNALYEQHRQLMDANDRLQSEVGQLANEKAASDDQYRQLADAKLQLENEFSRLVEDKNALSGQHHQLTEVNDRLQSEVGQLANEKEATDEQIRQLAEQKSQLQSEFDRLADEKNALNEEHRQLGDVNSRLQNDLIQLANEKAASDEQIRQLAEQTSHLQSEVAHIAHQKDELEAEREGLRRQNEQLLSEAREMAGERGSLADERTSLCVERSELRQQNELLRARITQLNDENSAMAVGKLTLVEQRDVLNRDVEQLRVRVAQLSEENKTLATAKEALAEEQARLVVEQKRLEDLEREINTAVSGRENTSAELYNALLQLSEMQERDAQNKAVVEAYESLSKAHDHLHDEADQLKEQIQRLSEERTAVESAWQALSAEAATLSESQQRLADNNAKLLAGLDEAREKLERAQQDQHTLASTAAELERERSAKLQAEAEVAAAIAEGERRLEEQERRFAEQAQQLAEQSSESNDQLQQHAEQAREFAQTIDQLERQLEAALGTRDSLARAREEAQVQLADAESRRGEYSLRIQELESQLAAAEERAVKAAELAAIQAAADREKKVAEPVRSVPVHDEHESQSASEAPAEFLWPSARSESAADDNLNSRDDETTESAGDAAWGRPASGAHAWHTADPKVQASGPAEERTADSWLDESEPAVAADKPNPWSEKALAQAPAAADAFGDEDATSPTQPPIDDALSSGLSSDWKQAAEQPESAFAEPVFAKPEDSAPSVQNVEKGPAAKHEPPSFIDRYSHMFADDGAASDEKPVRANEPVLPKPLATEVTRPESVALPSSKTEDEDSIEQYMAKLLQRVRGDSPVGTAAPDQPSRMPLNAPSMKPAGRPIERSSPPEASEGGANSTATQPVKRKPSAPVPATDLGALRALANETARMAIGRHELRKLRRNAVTKMIVSTLAGLTSLWLMLDSPDWISVQFVTACGALLAAAYWAGETCRMLFNSKQSSAYDGPEAAAERPETFAVPALPIDVEGEERK